MGYIASGNTVTVVAYLSQYGRQLLLTGDKSQFQVAYFALGDSDVNYFVTNLLDEGYVPDITGNSDCLASISLNIDILNKINSD